MYVVLITPSRQHGSKLANWQVYCVAVHACECLLSASSQRVFRQVQRRFGRIGLPYVDRLPVPYRRDHPPLTRDVPCVNIHNLPVQLLALRAGQSADDGAVAARQRAGCNSYRVSEARDELRV